MEEEPSESGSTCNSGWTVYLGSYMQLGVEEDDEDGLSMVSDASSGPPQTRENSSCAHRRDANGGCSHSASSPPSTASAAPVPSKAAKRRRVGTGGDYSNASLSASASACLEDTASSPFLGFGMENLDRVSNGSISAGNSSNNRASTNKLPCGFSVDAQIKDKKQGRDIYSNKFFFDHFVNKAK